jgi:hypothetical protein
MEPNCRTDNTRAVPGTGSRILLIRCTITGPRIGTPTKTTVKTTVYRMLDKVQKPPPEEPDEPTARKRSIAAR